MKTIDINSLVRENVKRMKPYSSARDDFQGNASVFLDANENPFNSDYNRYPDPHQGMLKKQIAKVKNVSPDQIFLGNGSDEAIDLLFRAFCIPKIDNVLIPQPTYGMYSVSADTNDVAIKAVSLTPDFQLDVDAIRSAWDQHTKLIFLCSPNNPSGNLLRRQNILEILVSFNGLVILDEAYIDFIDGQGLLPLLNTHKNLVILHTFSKAWGLAGLRLGMCFANPEVIAILNKIKPPYNINSITQHIALSYLSRETQKDAWVAEIRKEREITRKRLETIRGVEKIFPSDANFLLVRIKDATKVYQRLVEKGIIVRDRSNVLLCNDCLRITIGTAVENRKLAEALEQL